MKNVLFAGPNSTSSIKNSEKIKAMTTPTRNPEVPLIILQRNSSRWSKKDISARRSGALAAGGVPSIISRVVVLDLLI
jgi:hypothetical protein